MIIVSKAKIRFLNAGRTLTIADHSGRYKRGRDYAAGTHHHTTICRVEIIDTTTTHIHIRLAQLDPPRLLAARSEHGYTSDPMKAMRDEPEAVSGSDLKRIAQDGTLRFEQEKSRRASEAATLPLHARLERLEEAYARGEMRLGPDLRVIRRRIQNIQRAT